MADQIINFLDYGPSFHWLQRTFGEENVTGMVANHEGSECFLLILKQWPVPGLSSEPSHVIRDFLSAGIHADYHTHHDISERHSVIFIPIQELENNLEKARQQFPKGHRAASEAPRIPRYRSIPSMEELAAGRPDTKIQEREAQTIPADSIKNAPREPSNYSHRHHCVTKQNGNVVTLNFGPQRGS